MSSTASVYSARFSRLRQSSGVSFHAFSGSFSRALNRLSCSSSEMCSQNLTRIIPSSARDRSRPDDLVVGALPLLLGGKALHPLHEHPPVPGAVEHAHATPPGKLGPEAPQEVVALLVRGGSRELGHPDVPGSSGSTRRLRRAALARGVPALEQHAHRRADSPVLAVELPAERQAHGAAGAPAPPPGGRGLVLAQVE